MFILSRRPPAFQERMLKIVDSKETFKGDWKPKLPDFSSHISDEDTYLDEESEEGLSAFEEE